jgi:surface carbohydrate biosynthesis protein
MNSFGLAVVDNPHRELPGLYNLRKELKNANIALLFVSKIDISIILRFIRPNFVIYPKTTFPFCKLKSKHTIQLSYCIPCEHCHGIKSKFINHVGEDQSTSLYVDKKYTRSDWSRIFLPGQKHLDILKEINVFNHSSLTVTGTLNSDFWFSNNHEITPPLKTRKYIGVSTSFKSFPFGIRYSSIHKALSFHLEEDRLSVLSFELSYLRLLLKCIRDLPSVNFLIRPHPHENLENWKDISKIYANVKITSPYQPFNNWLSNCYAVISSFSTTSLDASLSGIIPISLHNLIDQSIYDSLPTHKKPYIFTQGFSPDSYSDLLQFISGCRKKPTTYSLRSEVLNNYSEIYNLKRNKSAAKLIADFIECDLIGKHKQRRILMILQITLLILMAFFFEIRRVRSSRRNNLMSYWSNIFG